jgi:hypothetical protein
MKKGQRDHAQRPEPDMVLFLLREDLKKAFQVPGLSV